MATHRLQLTTVPLWSIIGRLCCGMTLLIPLVVTACTETSVPPLSRQLAHTNQLVQPLSLDELYRATPLSPMRALIDTPPQWNAAAALQQGERLYAVNCAPCHQANGEGNLQRFPALNNNALVTARDPGPLIQTVSSGRGIMPAFAPVLPAHELAAVLSYIRNAWDNAASVITATQVSQVQAATIATPTVATPTAQGKERGQIAQIP